MYATLSLKELLANESIDTDLLMPKEQTDETVELNKDPEDPAPFLPFLPLHIFDNDEFDCRTPEEWISMGQENGTRKPVPGKALLPKKDSDAACKCFATFASGLVWPEINPFPNKPLFLRVCSTGLLKTLLEKEKLLVMSNFSFSCSVFYPFGELSAIFIKLEIVVCKLFQFGRA